MIAESSPISVVIPTRNRVKSTLAAINSVLNQTLLPNKIVIVDDASDEVNFNEINQVYPGMIEVHRNSSQLGANASRNIGASLCSSEFISFLDSDDLFHPKKLELQVRALSNQKHGFSCTGFMYENGKRFRLPDFSPSKLLIYNCLGGCSGLVISRSLFELESFDECMASTQDWELYLRLIKHTTPTLVQEPLYIYGQQENVRITLNTQKRISGHKILYQKHIQKNDDAPLATKIYHKYLQKVLGSSGKFGGKPSRIDDRLKIKFAFYLAMTFSRAWN